MVTRASKYFITAGIAALLLALVYGFLTQTATNGGVIGVATGEGGIIDAIVGPISLGWKGGVGEHVGYATFLTLAGVLFVLGGFTSAFRDGDTASVRELSIAQGLDDAEADAAVAIPAPIGLNYWPILAAVSAVIGVVGLVYSTTLLFVGGAGIVVAGFEWTVRTWSERATGDAEANRILRSKLLYPVEIPVGAAIVLGVIGLSVSRVLLAVSATGAVIYIIVLAAIIFALGYFLSTRENLERSTVVLVIALISAVIILGGIAGAIAGPRDHHGQGIFNDAVVEDASGVSAHVTFNSSNTY